MVYSQQQVRSAVKDASARRETRPTRNLARGLRLVAGSALVLASLALAFYAGRVEAGLPGVSELPPLPLLAWIPGIALVFLALIVLAWRRFVARSNSEDHHPADAADNHKNGVKLSTADTRNTWPDSSNGDAPSDPEHFQAAVARYFLYCKNQSACLALTAVSIDDLEPLADAIGQESVNERMHQTGLSLQSLVRSQGGIFSGPQANDHQHYLALLPNTDPDRALQVSEDMRMAVEDLGFDNPVPPRKTMTASLGLAVMVPNDGIAQSALFSAALQALERSRRNGGNRVEVELLDSRPER
jgi:GGDEF domain-containing protein